MKLRDIVRRDPKQLKITLKAEKRRKKDIPDEWLNIKSDGEEARRGPDHASVEI